MTDSACTLLAGMLAGLAVVFHTQLSAADWPMRGRDSSRNAVVADGEGPVDWKITGDKNLYRNVRWWADLGTLSHGDPVVSQGLVWVGTNNSHPRDPAHDEDAGVLMCFDERDGMFLYQYLSPRLPEGRIVDWPVSSQAGSPLIEGNRLWFCNTRYEVICLNIAPLLARTGPPTVVWNVDLRQQFGVSPRAVMIGGNASQCSIAGYQDWIYVNTTNAAGYHDIPSPRAPSLICFHKQTGEVKWKDNSPGENLLDVQHGSPLVAEIAGRAQVIMGQGDGWMRGFDALTGEVLWKFDINHKSKTRGRLRVADRNDKRNNLAAMPVLHNGYIYLTTGRHHEITGGEPGRLCCLDPTKRGEISSHVQGDDGQVRINPNSGVVWEYLGAGDQLALRFYSTVSSIAIHKGLVFATDTMGLLHGVDAATGKNVWIHELGATNYSCSPVIVGDRGYVPSESGICIFTVSREKQILADRETENFVESTPAFANGTLFLMTRNRLYAIGR